MVEYALMSNVHEANRSFQPPDITVPGRISESYKPLLEKAAQYGGDIQKRMQAVVSVIDKVEETEYPSGCWATTWAFTHPDNIDDFDFSIPGHFLIVAGFAKINLAKTTGQKLSFSGFSENKPPTQQGFINALRNADSAWLIIMQPGIDYDHIMGIVRNPADPTTHLVLDTSLAIPSLTPLKPSEIYKEVKDVLTTDDYIGLFCSFRSKTK